jgi:hypothetical protein
MNRNFQYFFGFASAVFLAACGGGGGNTTSQPASTLPTVAQSGVTDLSPYLGKDTLVRVCLLGFGIDLKPVSTDLGAGLVSMGSNPASPSFIATDGIKDLARGVINSNYSAAGPIATSVPKVAFSTLPKLIVTLPSPDASTFLSLREAGCALTN